MHITPWEAVLLVRAHQTQQHYNALAGKLKSPASDLAGSSGPALRNGLRPVPGRARQSDDMRGPSRRRRCVRAELPRRPRAPGIRGGGRAHVAV